ncbi:MAG: YggS family pyridoxal phosphate-dependent enzyme [Bacillota bacterium]
MGNTAQQRPDAERLGLGGTGIAQRLALVHRRIAEAACRAGRDPASITLVAVSKGVEAARIREALQCGQRIFGENRVRELVLKAVELGARTAGGPGGGEPGPAAVEWHMIGHLQRNKVRQVVPHIAMLHSLDSLPLAEELDRHLQRLGKRLDVLVEVNTSGEPTKFGVAPDGAAELVRCAARLASLRVVGLMTIGPNTTDVEAIRRAFRLLRELLARIRDDGLAGPDFAHLSMGMSGDFELAIQEGATFVRIGTAIFGARA